MKRCLAAAAAVVLLLTFPLHAFAHSSESGSSCAVCSVQRNGHAQTSASPELIALAETGETPPLLFISVPDPLSETACARSPPDR